MSLLTGNANVIKYVLFVFNFLFVLTGIVLISVGVTVDAVYNDYELFLAPKFFSIPTFLIVIGSFIFFIAFFGCCGAIRENYCMTLTFSILLILIFILELAAGISGYVLRNDTKDLIEKPIFDTMKDYGDLTKHYQLTKLWDSVQREFSCCGLNNATDWLAPLHTEETKILPISCCEIPVGAQELTCKLTYDNKFLFMKPCLNALSEYISDHAVSLGAAGIALAMIQFVGIIFACYVSREIKIRNGGSSGFF